MGLILPNIFALREMRESALQEFMVLERRPLIVLRQVPAGGMRKPQTTVKLVLNRCLKLWLGLKMGSGIMLAKEPLQNAM